MEYQYYHIVQKLQKRGSNPGLSAIQALLDEMEHPERALKIVHIAGTNGKGSVFAYLASVLQESGYRVGRYISPTIRSYEERFQINGKEISSEELENYYEIVEKARMHVEEKGKEKPTLFEVETALAFLYFADKKVDFALIETGMGGTLDATNIIEHPILTIISSVSYDHKAFLGDTLEKIAENKAGIIKQYVPVILEENVSEVRRVIEKAARDKEAPCIVLQKEDYTIEKESPEESVFIWKEHKFSTKLPGRHQISNAVTALVAIEQMGQLGILKKEINWKDQISGIEKTTWPGRLEILNRDPLVYRDGAHNPDGAQKLAQFLEKHFTNRKIIYIMGVLKDKEYEKMLTYLMPMAEYVYTFWPKNIRGLSGNILAEKVRSFGVCAENCEGVNEAVRKALARAKREDVIVICGSLSFMKDMEVKMCK